MNVKFALLFVLVLISFLSKQSANASQAENVTIKISALINSSNYAWVHKTFVAEICSSGMLAMSTVCGIRNHETLSSLK